MIARPQQLPYGNLLAAALNGQGDVPPDARMLGATQARAPMGPGQAPTPGLGNVFASLLNTQPAGTMVDPGATGAPPPNLAPAPVAKHGGFNWTRAAGVLGDALLGAVGQPGVYAPMMQRKHQEQREEAQRTAEWSRQDHNRQQDRGWQVEDRDAALNKPQYFMSGRDRVQYDPASGGSSVVYDGPEDYQTYADALGLDPADPGYENAVQDYVLRGNGPTSQAARGNLEQQRLQGRLTLRNAPTYAATHPRPRAGGGAGGGGRAPTTAVVQGALLQKLARGEPLTAGEREALSYRHGGGGRGGNGGAGGGSGVQPVRVNSAAEAAKLPVGTSFVTPDGQRRVRH